MYITTSVLQRASRNSRRASSGCARCADAEFPGHVRSRRRGSILSKSKTTEEKMGMGKEVVGIFGRGLSALSAQTLPVLRSSLGAETVPFASPFRDKSRTGFVESARGLMVRSPQSGPNFCAAQKSLLDLLNAMGCGAKSLLFFQKKNGS